MLRSKRSFLLNYMKQKSDFIEELTGIKLYEKFDYTRARRLRYNEVKWIIWNINLISNNPMVTDTQICPQCELARIRKRHGCGKCSYSLKHKACGGFMFSTYSSIRNSINNLCKIDIVDAIGQETIQLYFKWNK